MAYEASFGQWMVTRWRELRLQRTELAAQVGCAAITLRKIETDERRPSQQLAVLLAERLGLTPPDDLIFVRVARGELLVERLPTLPLPTATDTPIPPAAAVSVPRAPIRTNLPAPLTSFVGRTHELAELPELLATQRLVTLTGVGGVGKTRLATEVGIQLVRSGSRDLLRDGVWLVELAALAQPALVAQAIANVFRLPEQGGRPLLELLQQHLADTQLLLILDNCEHLVDACAELAEQLLLRCWQLRILATSREPLRVPGERAYPIPPLTLPSASDLQPTQVLATTAAQLFVARMESAGAPAARIGDADAAALAQICRQLDGIPLAIELAAPLSQHLALTEIASQLRHQMAILTNTYRTAIPRHQTMHSALIWSYRLLAPAEQQLLASVSVFAGGWTLEAAQAVCADAPPDIVEMRQNQLVAKSLVLVSRQPSGRRYRLLEPVRQFALAQLAAGGMEERVRRCHAEYFLTLAEQMHRARDTANERAWLDRLEPERDNLRAVNAWAIERGERVFALQFNGWLFAFWLYCAPASETRGWIDATLALMVPLQTPEALTAEALALDTAGYLAVQQRDYRQAQVWFERELQLYRTLNNLAGMATSLRGIGISTLHQGNLTQSQHYIEQSLAVAQSAKDNWGAIWSRSALGYLAIVRGDLATAQAILEEVLCDMRLQGNVWGVCDTLLNLGHIMRRQGVIQKARSYYLDELRLHRLQQYTGMAAEALDEMASIAIMQGKPLRATQLFGAAHAQFTRTGAVRWPHLDETYARDLALARSQLDPQQYEAAWEQGAALTLDQAVAYALEEELP